MIKIEISIGEALDRLSILYLKKQNINCPYKINYILKEISMLEESLENIDFKEFLQRMLDVNSVLWANNEKRKEKFPSHSREHLYLICLFLPRTKKQEESLLEPHLCSVTKNFFILYNTSILYYVKEFTHSDANTKRILTIHHYSYTY